MTCGINLGLLLICFLQAVHVCCSWALREGEGSRRDDANSRVGLSHVHGSFEGSRPQDEFRQAYVVKRSSTDGGANQKLYNQQYAHAASQAYPVKYPQSSQTNPIGYNMDTNGNVLPKNSFGLSSSIASGSVLSKQDSRNQHSGGLRTRPGQQGARRISQYAYSKPASQSSTQGLLSQSGSHQPTVWKPHRAAKAPQKPGLDKRAKGLKGDLTPPKEYVQATSGLSHGRKVNGGSRKTPYRLIQTNPLARLQETSQLPNSWQFGLQQSQQGSDYNQNPQLVSLESGVKPAPVFVGGPELQSGRLGPGRRFAPTRIYKIPRYFGGHPIKRLGDEEPVEQTTTTQMPKKPATQRPAKMYTFPPRHTESSRPRQQSVHQKSKWMRIRSNQLMSGAAGVHQQLL